MSEEAKKKLASDISFKKANQGISLVGPIIGSGANGEAGQLLLKSDGEMATPEGKIKMMQSLLKATDKLSPELLDSVAAQAAQLIKDLGTQPEATAQEPEPVAAAQPVQGDDDFVTLPNVLSDQAPAAEPGSSEPIQLVKSLKEPDNMSKMTEEDLKKAIQTATDTAVAAALADRDAKDEVLNLEVENLRKSNTTLLQAEESRLKSESLKKAQSYVKLVGEDGVGALAEQLLVVGEDSPMVKALNSAMDTINNADLLTEKGTGSEASADLTGAEAYQAEVDLRKSNNPDMKTADILLAIQKEMPEVHEARRDQ